MKHMSRRVEAVALVALAIASCSRDPQKQAEKYVASGDAYVARKQFNQAAIEYKNAVKAKPERADIHYKLAKVYDTRERRTSNRRIWMPSCRPACSCFPQESSKRHERGRNWR